MDVSSLGSLYYGERPLPAVLEKTGKTTSGKSPSTPFELMLLETARSQGKAESAPPLRTAPIPAVGRPVGAAANSGATDQEHAMKHKTTIDRTGKLYEQCQALEGFIVKTLLDGMRKTVDKGGLVDEGFAGNMYEDMLYDEYSKSLTKTAGFGLADEAYLELSGTKKMV